MGPLQGSQHILCGGVMGTPLRGICFAFAFCFERDMLRRALQLVCYSIDQTVLLLLYAGHGGGQSCTFAT